MKQQLLSQFTLDASSESCCDFVKMGLRKLKKWLIYARVIFSQTAETLSNHLTDICHDFINHTTNGMMEGMNNKIKLIIRQSYGFKNFELMREKLLACLFK